MGRRKPPLPIFEGVEIIDAGAEGKAVAKVMDKVLFVPYAAPGDVVDVQVYKKRKNYFEGKIKTFIKLSEIRIEPKCSYFGLCGGCKWQHIDYEQQKYFKWKQVKDALDRIAKVNYQEILPIIGADKIYYYRNKLEFTFSNRRWLTDADISKNEGGPPDTRGLGFHLPGMYDKILNIDKCYLQADPSNDIRLFIRDMAMINKLSFWNVHEQNGFLRNLIIRNASSGDIMVILIFGYDNKIEREKLLSEIAKRFPEITSLMYVINKKTNDNILDLDVITYKGVGYNIEIMPSAYADKPDLKFIIGPKSFYQTNYEQAYKLYKTVLNFANFNGNELVYDLYTGTGTIALFIARSVKHIVGIDSVKESIKDAKKNAEENNITNVEFYAGDMAKLLDKSFIDTYGHPDVIVTDPPRAGMHPKVIKRILETAPEKIIYISCNPPTQARDIAMLNVKYSLKNVQPVDMFPQTHHVENVVQLILK